MLKLVPPPHSSEYDLSTVYPMMTDLILSNQSHKEKVQIYLNISLSLDLQSSIIEYVYYANTNSKTF